MVEAVTMQDLIEGMGSLTRLRWWLFKRLSALGWLVCPQPMKSQLVVLWGAKFGEFKDAADRLMGK